MSSSSDEGKELQLEHMRLGYGGRMAMAYPASIILEQRCLRLHPWINFIKLHKFWKKGWLNMTHLFQHLTLFLFYISLRRSVGSKALRKQKLPPGQKKLPSSSAASENPCSAWRRSWRLRRRRPKSRGLGGSTLGSNFHSLNCKPIRLSFWLVNFGISSFLKGKVIKSSIVWNCKLKLL